LSHAHIIPHSLNSTAHCTVTMTQVDLVFFPQSRAHTVVAECCKDDHQRQWEMLNFGPKPIVTEQFGNFNIKYAITRLVHEVRPRFLRHAARAWRLQGRAVERCDSNYTTTIL